MFWKKVVDRFSGGSHNRIDSKKIKIAGVKSKRIEKIDLKKKKKSKISNIELKTKKTDLKKIKKKTATKKKVEKIVGELKQDISNKENEKKMKMVKIERKKEKFDKDKFNKTGIKGFDALFDKGFGIPPGASVLIEGGPGSGKTLFCLATINNLCKAGKKGLYMSFEEPEEGLIKHMEDFEWDAKSYVKKGLLRIKRFDAIDVSRSIEALLSAAKKELLIEVDPVFFPTDFEPDFVVIDSLTSILSAFSGQESRFRIYMEQLFRYLEMNKITNFLVREVSSPSHIGTTFKEQGEAVSFLSDGIIVIYNVIYDNGQRGFAIEILKMRGSSFKRKIVGFKIISRKGIFVNPHKILKKTKKDNFKLT